MTNAYEHVIYWNVRYSVRYVRDSNERTHSVLHCAEC